MELLPRTMPIFYLTAVLLCFSVWVIAENAPSRGVLRVVLGCFTMVAVATLAYSLARFGPDIESGTTRSSLRLAEHLMTTGNTDRVRQSIHAYNETASSASTYRASFELWYVLNHGPRVADTQKPDSVPPQLAP